MPAAFVEDVAWLVPGHILDCLPGSDEVINLDAAHNLGTERDRRVFRGIDSRAPSGDAIVHEVGEIGLRIVRFRRQYASGIRNPVAHKPAMLLEGCR